MYNIGRKYNSRERYNTATAQIVPRWYTQLGYALPIVVDEQLRPLVLLDSAHDLYNHSALMGEDRLTFSLEYPTPVELPSALLDMEGKIYRVISTRETDSEGPRTIEVEAWALWHDLTKMPYLPAQEWAEATPMTVMLWLLAGSGWTVGSMGVGTARHVRWGGGCNRLSLLRDLERIFGGELAFDTISRTVSFLHNVGSDSGLFFLRGKNLRSVEVETTTIETVHRLYPIGANGLTIETVNNGIPFLEVPSVYNPPPSATLETSITDAQQLKEYAERVFMTMLSPSVNYLCSIVDLSALPEHEDEDIHLGDWVTVYDEEAGVHIKTRVVRWKYDVESPWQSEIELAIPRPDLSYQTQAQQRAVEEVVEEIKTQKPQMPIIITGTPETDGLATVEAEILTDAGWWTYGAGPVWTGPWSAGWSRGPGTSWSGFGSLDGIAIVPGRLHLLEYTVDMTAGLVGVELGDHHYREYTASGTTRVLYTSRFDTEFIDVWADAAFSGRVSISLRPATFAVSPVIIGQTSAGVAVMEVRTPAVEGGTFVGLEAGKLVVGASNTAFGSRALRNTAGSIQNTAVGTEALMSNSAGASNTGVGALSLRGNTTGQDNTAVGANSLPNNTTGSNNTAVGSTALQTNTAGWANSALGRGALMRNTVGGSNSAVGWNALLDNTEGSNNTAVGTHALRGNSTGWSNTAVGANALGGGTGSNNTAVGENALFRTTTGANNTAVGARALQGGWDAGPTSDNTAVGANALHDNTGTDNTAVGTGALRSQQRSGSTAVGAHALTSYIAHNRFAHPPQWPNPELTAVGSNALRSLLDGAKHTAVGTNALMNVRHGWSNVAVGSSAMIAAVGGFGNTAVGADSLPVLHSGNSNVAIGNGALPQITTGSSNVAIGNGAGAGRGAWPAPEIPVATATSSIFIGQATGSRLDGQDNEIVIGCSAIGHGSNTATIGNHLSTTTILPPTLRLRAPITPVSATAPGVTGDICWDPDYLYVCVALNAWRRIPLAW